MSLTTLHDVKTLLGITGSSDDVRLTALLRVASGVIRNHINNYVGGIITGITAASPAVVTSVGHGLSDGDSITISGSDSGVSINGAQTITWISRDKFSVAVDNSAGIAGTTGRYVRSYTEFYNGTGTPDLFLRNRPVTAVSSVYLDNNAYSGQGTDPFPSTTLLTAGTDYMLDLQSSGMCKSGRLIRLSGGWPALKVATAGRLVARTDIGRGNIKVTYTAGYTTIPDDLQSAVAMLVQVLRKTTKKGLPITSESLDYYSYQLASDSEATQQLGSMKQILASYKRLVI